MKLLRLISLDDGSEIESCASVAAEFSGSTVHRTLSSMATVDCMTFTLLVSAE